MSGPDNLGRHVSRELEGSGQPYGNADEFTKYFRVSEVTEIIAAQVPPEAIRFFEDQSREYSEPTDAYKPGDFEKFLVISHNTQESTIIALQTKVVGVTQDTERLAYFVDMLEGRKIGHGVMRKNLSSTDPFLADKPFSEYIYAEEGYRGAGHGKRLLEMMNALTHAEYGLPLFSGMDIRNRGRAVWEELVTSGKARRFKEGTYDRYVMRSADEAKEAGVV